MPSDRLPKRRFATRVNVSTHLRDHRRREATSKRGDKHKTRERQKPSRTAAPRIGSQEKRTHFRRAAVIFFEVQNRDFLFDLERTMFKTLAANFITIPRMKSTDARRDPARADNLACGRILERKKV